MGKEDKKEAGKREKKIPTRTQIDKAIKSVAKKWADRSGMSIGSWTVETVSKLGFGTSEPSAYYKVYDMVLPALRETSYLKSLSVCGSTALSVKPGTTF